MILMISTASISASISKILLLNNASKEKTLTTLTNTAGLFAVTHSKTNINAKANACVFSQNNLFSYTFN